MQIDPKDLEFANMVIATEVNALIECGSIRRDEQGHFTSELLARLLAVWETYDPARAPREAFINIVISSQCVSLLRERNAQKRRGTTQSLDGLADVLVDRATSEGRQQHIINLRIDLAGVMPLLTPLQRQLVDLLQRDALAPIAEQMGIPRRTLRDQCARIREVFRDAGLEEYL
jgi:DNA-directed RNA polymerase specialized sigma24 family protein